MISHAMISRLMINNLMIQCLMMGWLMVWRMMMHQPMVSSLATRMQLLAITLMPWQPPAPGTHSQTLASRMTAEPI